MKRKCPNLSCPDELRVNKVIRFGSYFRPSDSRTIQRFKCIKCKKTFSSATFSPNFLQNKRRVNIPLERLLYSNVSLRRAAKILKVHRITVARKLTFLAKLARLSNQAYLEKIRNIQTIQFDDLETFEHTKCKPLSVVMAVTQDGRKILGFTVSQMTAKGHLAEISRKKYGKRKDFRNQGMDKLFSRIKKHLSKNPILKSDENPHYPKHVKKHFPSAVHKRYKGRKNTEVGQGELKKGGYDPLFSINHTFAMLRANISRLIRKTWCTTKKVESLRNHLEIYMNYHNSQLT